MDCRKNRVLEFTIIREGEGERGRERGKKGGRKGGREEILTLYGAADGSVATTPPQAAPASVTGGHTEGGRETTGHTILPAFVPRGDRGDGARGRGGWGLDAARSGIAWGVVNGPGSLREATWSKAPWGYDLVQPIVIRHGEVWVDWRLPRQLMWLVPFECSTYKV